MRRYVPKILLSEALRTKSRAIRTKVRRYVPKSKIHHFLKKIRIDCILSAGRLHDHPIKDI